MLHWKKLFSGLGVSAMAAAVVACGSAGSDAGSGENDATSAALAFHAEASPLADFKYDTGLLPEGSPAQVELKLSAGGGITVDVAAQPGSAGLEGKPGGGKLALDIHMKMTGRLKVDSTFKSYDGEIPGLANIDIPIAGDEVFDGLLLGDSDNALATADLPETTLPEIPLGSIPGSLILTVSKGSQLTTKYRGTCLSVASGSATYTGASTTSGTLVLNAKIVLKLPAPLDKSIDLLPITVTIPEVTTKVEGAALSVGSMADAMTGNCNATAAANGATPSSPSSGGGPSNPAGGDPAGPTNPAPPSNPGTPPAQNSCIDNNDPGATEGTATMLADTSDAQNSPIVVNGVLNGSGDVDYYSVKMADTAFHDINDDFENKGVGTEMCVFMQCVTGSTNFKGCNAGTQATSESGEPGCCATGVGSAIPAWSCGGFTQFDGSAQFHIRVRQTANECLPYAFSYAF
jgi:hypothetical protein